MIVSDPYGTGINGSMERHHQSTRFRRKRRPRREEEERKQLDIEAALEEQRRRTTKPTENEEGRNDSQARSLTRVTKIQGYYYDATRGRYFKASSTHGRPTPSQNSQLLTSDRASPYNRDVVFNRDRGGVVKHLLAREEKGRSDHDLFPYLTCMIDIHVKKVADIPDLEDLDYYPDRHRPCLAAGKRNGVVSLIEEFTLNESRSVRGEDAASRFCEIDLTSCPSPINAVRWRKPEKLHTSTSRILAVAQSGGGGVTAACQVIRVDMSEDAGQAGEVLSIDRFPLRHGHASMWTLAWEPQESRLIALGVSKNNPLAVCDVVASRTLTYGPSLESDCFSCCWGESSNLVFLGMRNGTVNLLDFRCNSRSLTFISKLGSIIDKQHLLLQQRGCLVVSDRMGQMQVLDLRVTGGRGGGGRPLLQCKSLTGQEHRALTSTGFVVDPLEERLCLAVDPSGRSMRAFDLSAEGPPLQTWSFLPSSSYPSALSPPPRCFLSAYWAPSLLGEPSTLWAGCRGTGKLYQVGLSRR